MVYELILIQSILRTETSSSTKNSRTFRFDLQCSSHKSKKCSVKHDSAITVQRHVHSHQPLEVRKNDRYRWRGWVECVCKSLNTLSINDYLLPCKRLYEDRVSQNQEEAESAVTTSLHRDALFCLCDKKRETLTEKSLKSPFALNFIATMDKQLIPSNRYMHKHIHMSLLGLWIILWPDPLKFIKMMWPQNRPITGKIVKVVHDDSHKQVNNLKQDIIQDIINKIVYNSPQKSSKKRKKKKIPFGASKWQNDKETKLWKLVSATK